MLLVSSRKKRKLGSFTFSMPQLPFVMLNLVVNFKTTPRIFTTSTEILWSELADFKKDNITTLCLKLETSKGVSSSSSCMSAVSQIHLTVICCNRYVILYLLAQYSLRTFIHKETSIGPHVSLNLNFA
ncbi:CLUMA_CG003663, isoform A [Clunio marinus]|uniref:CLUMA_CG003663, isoform A n=1 Tax=Clunio marinus TaxID=568069 RepID=A0A1J1HPF8_9DIPT|nr:CLUMA_CG003663, isoform A [Clunio marinus]